jgi:hypothetical protein
MGVSDSTVNANRGNRQHWRSASIMLAIKTYIAETILTALMRGKEDAGSACLRRLRHSQSRARETAGE